MDFVKAIEVQEEKLNDSAKTPAAKIITEMKNNKLTFHELTLKQSNKNRSALQANVFDSKKQKYFKEIANKSQQELLDLKTRS